MGRCRRAALMADPVLVLFGAIRGSAAYYPGSRGGLVCR